ncbi:hypothetical protein CU097_013085 [Rhizopus azygosporus]|uniref:HTH APSES-type domain-containing protein n=1 Tax=Rhizopus azygosporus TaxID=86630 RepID=A0A367KAA5_RHIAZ|nr:hypothetical protein CU097_013085 [Rhizopus azygosporus]
MKIQQQKQTAKYHPYVPLPRRFQLVIKAATYATSQNSRGAIPVFQLESNGHLILWDSENGLALGNSKTDIAKIIAENPNLHVKKVRGGCLAIQGTWMPFESAKELCMKNIWALRFDLVPLFGKSFPIDCCPPSHPGFGSLKVGSAPIPEDSQVSPGLATRSSRPSRGRASSASGGFSPYEKASTPRRSVRQKERSLSSASCPSASGGRGQLVSPADDGAACRTAGSVARVRASHAPRVSSGSPYLASSSPDSSTSSCASPSVLSRRRRHCMSTQSLLNDDEEEDCYLVVPSAFSWLGLPSSVRVTLPPMVISGFEGEKSGAFTYGSSGFLASLPTAKIIEKGMHRDGSDQQETSAAVAEIIPLFGPSSSVPSPLPVPARLTSQEQDVIERVEAGIALQCLSQHGGRCPKDFLKNRFLPIKVRAGNKIFHVL